MKRLLNTILLLTVSVMAFDGCMDNQLSSQENAGGVDMKSITLVSGNEETKTQMNPDGTDVIWSAPETVNYYADGQLIPADKVSCMIQEDKLYSTLTFEGNPEVIDGFVGAAGCPEIDVMNGTTIKAFGISLPTVQRPIQDSFDSKADALVMDSKNIAGLDLTNAVTGVKYNRLNAVTRIDFTGLDEFVQDVVTSIDFETSSTEIAGDFTYDYTEKAFVDIDGNAKAGSPFNARGSKKITLILPEGTTIKDLHAWMVMAALDLPSGEKITLTLTVPSEYRKISKTFTLPAKMTFSDKRLNVLPVDMTGAKIVEPRNYTTVSTLETSIDLGDFRGMEIDKNGNIVVVAGWDKIYTIDPANGNAEVLYDLNIGWTDASPRALNGISFNKDKTALYLVSNTADKGAGDLYVLKEESSFKNAECISRNINEWSAEVAVNPSDGTVLFNGAKAGYGEAFYWIDNDGSVWGKEGFKTLGGGNGGSRFYFNEDGTKLYRFIYEGADIWDLGVIYSYDYNTATKQFTNETLVAGADLEPGYADGNGSESRFRRPFGATMDQWENLYVADGDNHCIRKVTPDGKVTTLAGVNEAGVADGPVADARFTKPVAIVMGPDGTLYVAQNGNKWAPASIRIIK